MWRRPGEPPRMVTVKGKMKKSCHCIEIQGTSTQSRSRFSPVVIFWTIYHINDRIIRALVILFGISIKNQQFIKRGKPVTVRVRSYRLMGENRSIPLKDHIIPTLCHFWPLL